VGETTKNHEKISTTPKNHEKNKKAGGNLFFLLPFPKGAYFGQVGKYFWYFVPYLPK
jgi:hypothetical protein